MMEQHGNWRVERVLMPYPFFAAALLSFLACCLGGSILSRLHFIENLQDGIHPQIHPTTFHCLTAPQIQAFGQAYCRRDKIMVVIGGNSVLQGYGQGQNTWAKDLQKLLGAQYQVVNFAMGGANPGEFGAVAAEILGRDFEQLIFVTNTFPGRLNWPPPDGSGPYQYLLWDAYWKGMLTDDAARAEQLSAILEARRTDPTFVELQRRMQLDRTLHFQDLWTTLAYTHLSTIWHQRADAWFLKPRRAYPTDVRPVHVPIEKRYGNHTAELKFLQDYLHDTRQFWATLGNEAATSPTIKTNCDFWFPEPCRKRTLFLITHHSPYYVNKLAPAEQAFYSSLGPQTRHVLDQAGFVVLDVGRGRNELDYVDVFHLSEEGAAKLANEVAPRIRALAQQLGYHAAEGGMR